MPSPRKPVSGMSATNVSSAGRADNPDTDISPIPLWLWPLLWIGCVAIALGLQPNSNQQRSENSVKLKMTKTAAEQARIAVNYADYRKLPEDERNHYRQFHQELIGAIGGNPDLGLTLDDYCNWVRNLAQEDRERLHKATDAQSKLRVMDEIKDRQRRSWQEVVSVDPRPNEDVMSRGLSRKDLTAVVEALEPHLRQRMSAERYRELDGKPFLEKCFLIFRNGFDDLRSGRPTPPVEVYQSLEEAISDPRQKRLLKDQTTQEGKWWTLLMLVRSGLRHELMQHKPTPEELASVEAGLQGDDRRRFDRSPPEHRSRYLMFLAQQQKFPALKEYVDQMIRREGWGRFPGGPGGPGGPRGEGGPRGDGFRPGPPPPPPGEGGRRFDEDRDRGPDGERRKRPPEEGRGVEGEPFGGRPFRDRRPGDEADRPPPRPGPDDR
jgi:hypothetical protein